MLLYTCEACRRGFHDQCSGERPPPKGMIGGSKCDCKCAQQTPHPREEPREFRMHSGSNWPERGGGLADQEGKG